MDKIDLKKELAEYYNPKKDKFVQVNIKPMKYIMIDGVGNPNTSQDFQDKVGVLFGISYAVKFLSKEIGRDYTVMPLEGLWWADEMSDFIAGGKENWKWTLMIMQPDFINEDTFNTAREKYIKKNPENKIPASEARFEIYAEGDSVQVMYIGAFADEGPTIKKMHEFITGSGYELNGKHHEIYLSDFRKTEPAKLKTIIRQPYK
jgi:hypothetical protein